MLTGFRNAHCAPLLLAIGVLHCRALLLAIGVLHCRALLLAIGVLHFGVAAADEIELALPEAWKRIEASDLRFQISLPPKPVRSENVRSTWVGTVKELDLRAELPGAEFSVQVRDLPRAARWLVTQNYIFSQVKDGFLEFGRGTRIELSDEAIERSGFSGRHIRFEDPERGDGDWIEDALVFLGNDRLYFVIAARSRAAESRLPIAAFFRSFELW